MILVDKCFLVTLIGQTCSCSFHFWLEDISPLAMWASSVLWKSVSFSIIRGLKDCSPALILPWQKCYHLRRTKEEVAGEISRSGIWIKLVFLTSKNMFSVIWGQINPLLIHLHLSCQFYKAGFLQVKRDIIFKVHCKHSHFSICITVYNSSYICIANI